MKKSIIFILLISLSVSFSRLVFAQAIYSTDIGNRYTLDANNLYSQTAFNIDYTTDNINKLININGHWAIGYGFTAYTSELIESSVITDEDLDIKRPLSTKFSHIAIKGEESAIRILWSTVSQKDQNIFIVERSTDNYNFSAIGEVKADYTSTEDNLYDFVDYSPSSGSNYYRLKQIDRENDQWYSPSVHLKFTPKEEDLVNAYPNWTKTKFTVELLQEAIGPVVISMFNQMGSKMQTWQFKEGGRVFENHIGQTMEPGIYIVKIMRRGKLPLATKVIVE